MRFRLALLGCALAAPSLASADKQACVQFGQALYAVQPELSSIEKAFRHCRPLAEEGDGEAQYYFASVFMFRTPSQPPDSPHVELWMQRSADNGYGKAQLYMATVYRYGGFHTRPNLAKAIALYEKAAANGVIPAPLELAHLYRDRASVAGNGAKAVHWYEFAARKFGLRNAMGALVDIYAKGIEGVQRDAGKAQHWKRRLESKQCPSASCD